MPTKRQRDNGKWEFIIKRKGLLPRPLSRTYDTEAEGDRECALIEAALDRGIVPRELQEASGAIITVADAIREYQKVVQVGDSDMPLLASLEAEHAAVKLVTVNFDWLERWITAMKREHHRAPGTIRHYVGALSRCFDWCVRKEIVGLQQNPCSLLPRGYAAYTDEDARLAGGRREDEERDRRLRKGENEKILAVVAKQPDAVLLDLMYHDAVESAMRMREIYTLDADQVDLRRATIFLDKTKNGDKRQVPMSSILQEKFKAARLKKGQIFPWWNGRYDQRSLRATTSELSRIWANIFEEAGCPDLHFHDLRHEATSRLYERTKLTDLQISKITGHKDLRQLRRYANLRGSSLAVKLW